MRKGKEISGVITVRYAALSLGDGLVAKEVINGREVMMSRRPAVRHALVAGNIYNIFANFLKGKRCKVFFEPDVFLDEDNNFVPDVAIFSDRKKIGRGGVYGAPRFGGGGPMSYRLQA